MTNQSKTQHVSTTPAGGGDITPAPDDRSTSLAKNPGEASGVVEPPKPEASPAAAGSDEMLLAPFELDLSGIDDDSDPIAFQRSRRLIFTASNDGQITIHRHGDTGIALTHEEAHKLYGFLADTASVWRNE
jgi:hypothetical protein